MEYVTYWRIISILRLLCICIYQREAICTWKSIFHSVAKGWILSLFTGTTKKWLDTRITIQILVPLPILRKSHILILDIFLKCQKLPREMSINVWLLSNYAFLTPFFFFRELRTVWWNGIPCSDAVSWLGGPAILENQRSTWRICFLLLSNHHNKHAVI